MGDFLEKRKCDLDHLRRNDCCHEGMDSSPRERTRNLPNLLMSRHEDSSALMREREEAVSRDLGDVQRLRIERLKSRRI